MAVVEESLLDRLRSRTQVFCDTLDVAVAGSLGPFHGATSNQAIAFTELQRIDDDKDSLIANAAKKAAEVAPVHPGPSRLQLATELSVGSQRRDLCGRVETLTASRWCRLQ